MKKIVLGLCLLMTSMGIAQSGSRLLSTKILNTTQFVGCDAQLNLFHFDNTVLTKISGDKTLSYSNYEFGNITSVDISNPLKIVVFYRDFNQVVLLDTQLNETERIHFEYDISFVARGTANNLWLFTTNTQHIENYNFKTNQVTTRSQPLTNLVVENMKSTANYVYLLSATGIHTFDYLGNFISLYENTELDDFQYKNRELYTLSSNKIYRITDTKEAINIPIESKIKNFYTINNDFFIFDDAQLFHYTLDEKQ